MKPAKLEVKDIERLEFSGMIDKDGPSTPFDDQGYKDWPEKVEINGVMFRLEETDDGISAADDEERVYVAWYVPDDGTSPEDRE
jgi:hypothetical protein